MGNKIDLYQERQVTLQDILKYISQVEAKLNVKIYGNFEVTCQWGEIIDNIMNSIITDLVSNDCYQDVRGYNYYNKRVLQDDIEEHANVEEHDDDDDDDDNESFYSVGDKIIDISEPHGMTTQNRESNESSCCN